MQTHNLLYRVVQHNGGMVIAPEARARRIAAIHTALSDSKSWRELAQKLPDGEYEVIVSRLAVIGEELPELDDPFEPEQVPGWSDGDYPPWLQREMDSLLVDIDLTPIARRVHTVHNGSYWHIDQQSFELLRSVMESKGYRLIAADALPFH